MDLFLQLVDSVGNVVVMGWVGRGFVRDDAVVGQVEVFLSRVRGGGT